MKDELCVQGQSDEWEKSSVTHPSVNVVVVIGISQGSFSRCKSPGSEESDKRAGHFPQVDILPLLSAPKELSFIREAAFSL